MKITGCRSCGSQALFPVLDLGCLPLANALLAESQLDAVEPRFPLELVFCEQCSLAQITETVDPDRLFGHYLYLTSVSDTAVSAARSLAHRIVRERMLGPGSLVMEAGSNDGYLLRHYRDCGVPVLGIEPARNIADTANRGGIPTLPEFFGTALCQRLRDDGRLADVVHANNVLAHVADLNGFVAGVAAVLKPGGVAVIEVPHVQELVERLEFDTIYHEHLCYFSLTALRALLARHGLTVVDVERLSIHGGSLRVFASADDRPARTVGALLEAERARGIDRVDLYLAFAEGSRVLAGELVSSLRGLKSDGKRIAAYGASAKGTVLLNYCGIGADTLDYLVDRSPAKQGLYAPGTHLPIFAPERLLEDRPNCVLLLTWNFADEILEQQARYRETGGTFLLPLPTPQLV
jgi:SAM-dependent methyltransferase